MIVSNTPQEAFEKISRVRDWWAVNFEGKSQNIDDVFTVSFKSGDKYKLKVSQLIPDKKITWQVIDSHQGWVKHETEWTGSQIVWEILGKKDGTQINMTHVGLTPKIECHDKCIQAWDYLLYSSLLKLLTENQGLPV